MKYFQKRVDLVFLICLSDLPHVTIRGGTSVKTVPVGGNLTLECIGTGSPQPRIRWSRIDGPLSEGLVIEGGFLIVQNARLSYGGAYKCEVTNRVGSVQSRVAVFVQGSSDIHGGTTPLSTYWLLNRKILA